MKVVRVWKKIVPGLSPVVLVRLLRPCTQNQNKNFDVFLKNTSDTGISGESGFSYKIATNLQYNWSSSSTPSELYDSGSMVLRNGTWNHIAVYTTPTRFILWLNGQTAIYSAARNYTWENSYLTLGNYLFSITGEQTGLYGYLNDLRVYNGTSDFLSDLASYSTLGTTYPKINDYFSASNITTSANGAGNSNFVSLVSPVRVIEYL